MLAEIKELEERVNKLKPKAEFGSDLCNLLMNHFSSPLFKRAQNSKGFKRQVLLHTVAVIQYVGINVYNYYDRQYWKDRMKLSKLRIELNNLPSIKEYYIKEGLIKSY